MVDGIVSGEGMSWVAALAARELGGSVAIVLPSVDRAVIEPRGGERLIVLSTYVADRMAGHAPATPSGLLGEVTVSCGDERMGAVLHVGHSRAPRGGHDPPSRRARRGDRGDARAWRERGRGTRPGGVARGRPRRGPAASRRDHRPGPAARLRSRRRGQRALCARGPGRGPLDAGDRRPGARLAARRVPRRSGRRPAPLRRRRAACRAAPAPPRAGRPGAVRAGRGGARLRPAVRRAGDGGRRAREHRARRADARELARAAEARGRR